MTGMRPFNPADIPVLEGAIERDQFHPGEWKVEHFTEGPVSSSVIEDDKGPIVFVRFTKTLRISVVWNDASDTSRNARAIIFGIKDAVDKARASGFTEIIITTSHPKLQVFLERVMKMSRSGDEYLLAV
jgi:hypothetical protein